jgi:hypothetical protein
MNFYPHEMFPIPKQANGLVASNKTSLNQFWEQLDASLGDELSAGVGCYVFSIRAGKGVLPWYVGRAEKQSFRNECFTHHKITHYNNAIAARKGTPLLTLVAKYTPGGTLVRPKGVDHPEIRHLETMIIGNCLGRNEKLLNVKDTKFLRKMVVPGLLNSPKGKPPATVQAFKALIGA